MMNWSWLLTGMRTAEFKWLNSEFSEIEKINHDGKMFKFLFRIECILFFNIQPSIALAPIDKLNASSYRFLIDIFLVLVATVTPRKRRL